MSKVTQLNIAQELNLGNFTPKWTCSSNSNKELVRNANSQHCCRPLRNSKEKASGNNKLSGWSWHRLQHGSLWWKEVIQETFLESYNRKKETSPNSSTTNASHKDPHGTDCRKVWTPRLRKWARSNRYYKHIFHLKRRKQEGGISLPYSGSLPKSLQMELSQDPGTQCRLPTRVADTWAITCWLPEWTLIQSRNQNSEMQTWVFGCAICRYPEWYLC